MAKDSAGRSFADYLEDTPLAPDTSAKLVLTGRVRRSTVDGKFVFSTAGLGTVELDVEAVQDYEALDDGLTRITLDAAYVGGLRASRAAGPRMPSRARGLVPFVMATPHHASAAAAVRDRIVVEGTESILDVETAYIKDVWGDEGTDLIKDVSSEETIPVNLIPF